MRRTFDLDEFIDRELVDNFYYDWVSDHPARIWTDKNWGLYGLDRNMDERGFFYIGIDKSKSKHAYKYGISKNPDSRIARYQKEGIDFEYLYVWEIKGFKVFEKYVKDGILQGWKYDHTFHEFSNYYRYWKWNGANSSWGMNEWMNFDSESVINFAHDIENWIFLTMHEYKPRKLQYVHFIPGRTNLHFEENRKIEALINQKEKP